MYKSEKSWWPRFWAWLIDIIIIGVISWILFSPWNMAMPGMMNDSWMNRPWNFWSFGANGILVLLYFGFLDAEGRQSIGKKALNLKQMKNGKSVPLLDSFISAFGKAFLLPLDFIIGVLARPGKKQRLFNIASDTTVVRV